MSSVPNFMKIRSPLPSYYMAENVVRPQIDSSTTSSAEGQDRKIWTGPCFFHTLMRKERLKIIIPKISHCLIFAKQCQYQ
jgi:hypothetical protein